MSIRGNKNKATGKQFFMFSMAYVFNAKWKTKYRQTWRLSIDWKTKYRQT